MMHRGMTLIELLVGVVIATIVGYIAFDLIRDENGNYTRTRTKVKLQADAREAIRIIEEDLANIGYRQGLLVVRGQAGTKDTTATPINAKVHACDSSTALKMQLSNRVVVTDDNGSGSDIIEAQFYRPTRDSGVECSSSPWFVRYVVDNNQLWRYIWEPGSPSHQADGGNATDKALILENVTTLQAQVDLDTTRYPATTPIALQTFKYPVINGERLTSAWSLSNTNATQASAKVKLTPKGDSALRFSGWLNTTATDIRFQSTQPLLEASTYQISCMIRVNRDFRSLFHSSTGNGTLSARSIVGADTLGTLSISLPAIVDGPTWVSWVVQTRKDTGSLRLVFGGQLARDSIGSNPILDIGSLKVTRLHGPPLLGATDRTNWQNGSAASTTGAQTKGLRIWLVSKSPKGNRENDQIQFSGIGNWDQNNLKPSDKNSYVVYERTIPVVHYGY
ncbi:MAG: hypothetical protein RL173_1806 [Fibrobacterota bacterium]|jgi:prepilin-type N-terminal cleavage/methylation domain-containing protein